MFKFITSGIFLTLTLPASLAMAAVFTVNDTADLTDAIPGDGVCEATAGLGDCTLRAAVMEANATAGPHVIELPAGDFVLTIDGVGNDDASAGDLDILTSVTVRGAGSAHTRIDGNNSNRVFHVHSGLLDLEDLTIQNGRADNSTEFFGGGILAGANLGLRRVHMTGNRANSGAAIFAGAINVEIEESTFTGNLVEDLGYSNQDGNAFTGNGTLFIVTGTTISGNGPPVGTGSTRNNIFLSGGGGLDLVNSTVANNNSTAVQIENSDLFMSHSTITGNHGSQLQTFSFSGTHTIEVVGSILQRAPFGFVTCANQNHDSLGYNISDDNTCGFTATGDLEDTDALLGPLQLNGGPTPTREPQAGSPAINLVPAGSCLDEDKNPLTHDQRGFPRPAPGTANCDAGAVETGNVVIFEDRFES